MGEWRDFALPDGSYSDETRPWTQQDVCNYLPTFAEGEGTRSRLKLATAPGLRLKSVVGAGPHRGARDVEGKRFVVSGNKLYQVPANGIPVELGTIPGTRRVSMTHNQISGGNQLGIATGDNFYVWDTVAETLTATGIPLLFVDFVNQLFVGVDVARRFWRYSGLADGTSWNTLDNESAEASPDRVTGLIVSQGEVLIFGERTIEVWSNSPTDTTAFQRTEVIEKGCANGNTVCRLDNTVFFVGDDRIPYRLNGYVPVPIASKAISTQLGEGDPDKLFANVYEDRGYVIYYITAQDGRTWGYDVTSQRWHRRESFGLDRWRINTLFKWNGSWWAGDYSNGNLYLLEWGLVYEGDDIFPRSVRSGVMHNDGDRVFIHALRLFAATGGASGDPAADDLVASGDLTGGYIGDAKSGAYRAVGGIPPYTYAVTSGAFPAGLTLASNGAWSGTLSTQGEYSWTVTVTDAAGSTDTLADSADVQAVIMPAQSSWRYLQIDAADGTDYSASAFDDSAWAVGTAPFGSWEDGSSTSLPAAHTYDARFASAMATVWTANTRLWCRRTLTLSSIPDAGINVRAYIEDNFHVYVNGVLVATSPADPSGGNGQVFNVPSPGLVVGDNIIAVRCDDEAPNAGVSVVYFDLLLETE
jgi:hypothetical protein